MKKNMHNWLASLRKVKSFLFFTAIPSLLISGMVGAQSDCVGPSVDKKSYQWNPPFWEKIGEGKWENPEHSAQMQLTTHPLKPDVTMEKYAKEYPQNLKVDHVQILKLKKTKIGLWSAFVMEGKQPTGHQMARLKSISLFTGPTLYFFTLIANPDAYKKAVACFDGVVATLKEHPAL